MCPIRGMRWRYGMIFETKGERDGYPTIANPKLDENPIRELGSKGETQSKVASRLTTR